MTITDHYREDRAAASTGIEKTAVWRTYAIALCWLLKERGRMWVTWRKAAGDDDLPQPYKPYWRALSDTDVSELEDTLIRARERGE